MPPILARHELGHWLGITLKPQDTAILREEASGLGVPHRFSDMKDFGSKVILWIPHVGAIKHTGHVSLSITSRIGNPIKAKESGAAGSQKTSAKVRAAWSKPG